MHQIRAPPNSLAGFKGACFQDEEEEGREGRARDASGEGRGGGKGRGGFAPKPKSKTSAPCDVSAVWWAEAPRAGRRCPGRAGV